MFESGRTMTDNENPTAVIVGRQNAEPTSARLTSLESSMADIIQHLQQLLAQSLFVFSVCFQFVLSGLVRISSY